MKISFIQKAQAGISLLLLGVFINSAVVLGVANAGTLATDLQGLLSDASVVDTQLQGVTLTDSTMCSELFDAHKSVSALISQIEILNAGMSGPVSVDSTSLQALDDLSAVMVNMATKTTGLSLNLTALNNTTDMLAISNGISAMLRLSSDIGVMADRILEMSDKILMMADNIGLMADRIIITQQIQSSNLALTQASILTTQQNSLSLVSVVNTTAYNADFDAQTLTGNFLSFDITATELTVLNMAREWSTIAADVASLKLQIETTHEVISASAKTSTMYADADSYAALADMSIMLNSVAIATQGLALATEGLAPITSDAKLSPSMDSVLQLSADIGVMADRILEMADLILAMADNIGLTADQIIATQQLQSTNYATTLASVEATQSIAVTIIAVNSL